LPRTTRRRRAREPRAREWTKREQRQVGRRAAPRRLASPSPRIFRSGTARASARGRERRGRCTRPGKWPRRRPRHRRARTAGAASSGSARGRAVASCPLLIQSIGFEPLTRQRPMRRRCPCRVATPIVRPRASTRGASRAWEVAGAIEWHEDYYRARALAVAASLWRASSLCSTGSGRRQGRGGGGAAAERLNARGKLE
jgi:hypothetical protein